MKNYLSKSKLATRSLIALLIVLASLFGQQPPALADDSSAYPLTLKAFSPGYGDQKSGAFIELMNVSGQPSISLAGFSIRYTNTSGNRSNVIEFPEGSTMTGEYLLIRYASSPEAGMSDLQYKKIIAKEAGPLELIFRDQVVASVCWTGGKGCLAKFGDPPTAIVQDTNTKTFSHDSSYVPSYTEGRETYIPPPDGTATDDAPPPHCQGLQFSEILTYYETDKSEQFIEIYNSTEDLIALDGCKLRYKKKLYPLSGNLAPADYFVYTPTGFTLTKNPTSSNLLEIIDTDDAVVSTLEYPHGQKKTATYALFGYQSNGTGNWLITYHSTPGAANIYQEYRSCPAGKVINPSTGNCIKAATLEAVVTECPAGKYRNPETERCKKYNTSTTSACKEGYERNPETNRCRKIRDNTGAAFSFIPETAEERTTFIAFAALAALALASLGYTIFQYRKELRSFFRKGFYSRFRKELRGFLRKNISRLRRLMSRKRDKP